MWPRYSTLFSGRARWGRTFAFRRSSVVARVVVAAAGPAVAMLWARV